MTPRHGISELRQDPVTGDWVVVATGRARRPDEYAKFRSREKPQPKAGCPFERVLPTAVDVYDRAGRRPDPRRSGHPRLLRDWWVQVVPNKYPAFAPGLCPIPQTLGPYQWQDGIGLHEVVITRDHTRSLGAMTSVEAGAVMTAYRARYLALKGEDCVRYISIFHNHGREAGASVTHPHSQVIAIPVTPPDVSRSLAGSAAYYRRHRTCVHCAMVAFERRQGWRIVFENTHMVAFCPYVSRSAFEIRIFPTRHAPAFEEAGERELASAAEALRVALAKLQRGLGDPHYNFFIHTAPVAGGVGARHYHWHVEIIPKTAVWAGFEIGTGIEISTVSPEAAAAFLRKIKV